MSLTLLRAITFAHTAMHAAGFDDAIVAGGACRDYILGNTTKDIDVFIEGRLTYGDIRARLQVAFPGCSVSRLSCFDYLNCEAAEVFDVYDPKDPFGWPIQVIVLRPGLNPTQRVPLMDFGICQAWFDGEMRTTPAFAKDKQDRAFTLVHCETPGEYRRSRRRYERLSERFRIESGGEWPLRVAAGAYADPLDNVPLV